MLKNFARATRNYPWLFVVIIASMLVIQLSEVIGPLYLKQFIDTITQTMGAPTLTQGLVLALVGYAIALFISWAFNRVQIAATIYIEARIQQDLTNKAFDYLMHHGHEFFINNFAGTLTRRVTRYARAYEQVFESIIINFLPTFLFTVGVIAVLFMRNHWLGIGLFIWTIFFLVLQLLMTQWRYQYKLMRAAQDSRLTGALSDSIGNHTAVAFFAAEESEKKRIADVVADWYQATLKSWFADAWNYGIQGFIVRAAQIGLLAGGLALWVQGFLSVGDFILIQVYMLTLLERVGGIGSNMRRLYDAFADANEMIDIFELPHGIADVAHATNLEVPKGEVSFAGVDFAFNPERPILDGFSLTAHPREKIALVGPSGAGKSTITKLLLRLYDINAGIINIDGVSIMDVTQQSLRRAISFVPQEPVLFHRTLRDNIAYGSPDATLEDVIAAAKKARCHEFISDLPQGYETYVGERGVKLSGGERQRVAIARAILKNAPILVLDEATSSLDSESEHLIQEALDTLMEGKTVIVIAHRLSTIMKMDRIVVMENGAIAAQGTHTELLAEDGLYKKLWSIQAGGFLGGEDDSEQEDPESKENGA